MISDITDKKHVLRKGFTTGTYVSAAAAAGVRYLSSGLIPKSEIVRLPCGDLVNINFTDVKTGKDWIKIKAIKDSGDDPDITNGIEIVVETRYSSSSGIEIKAGKGVGVVTLPGLQVPVGKPAINPVPMKMIFENINKYIKPGNGYIITISIPEGEKIAKKTFNPRLGIKGGLSILGTTGYVEPKSVDAIKKTIEISIDVVASLGFINIVFVPGNIGENLCRNYFSIEKEKIIQFSNYIGHSLEYASKKNIKKILLCGHIGKLVKVAAGAKDTSSAVIDKRIETLSKIAKICNYKELAYDILKKCKTAENAADIILRNKAFDVFSNLATIVSKEAEKMCDNKIFIRSAVFNYKGKLLGTDLKENEIDLWK